MGQLQRPVETALHIQDRRFEPLGLCGILTGVHAFDKIIQCTADPHTEFFLCINAQHSMNMVYMFIQQGVDLNAALGRGAAECAEQFDQPALEQVDSGRFCEQDPAQQ